MKACNEPARAYYHTLARARANFPSPASQSNSHSIVFFPAPHYVLATCEQARKAASGQRGAALPIQPAGTQGAGVWAAPARLRAVVATPLPGTDQAERGLLLRQSQSR